MHGRIEKLPGDRPFLQLRAQHAPGLFGFERASIRPRAECLRDGFAPVVFPRMLAARLGRPLKRIDDWLPVAIPDALAAAFGGGVSVDAGRAFLRHRLADLCAWLDERLEDPLRVTDEGASRLVTVCGCVAWRVNFVARRVYPARVFADGTVQEQSIESEVRRPLRTGYWLHWLLENLGLAAAQGQGTLFATKEDARRHDDWLAATAQRLLLADPRFAWLRAEGIPRALSLNAELLALASSARYVGWQGRVPQSTYNLVWRHEAQFRQVARENPRLLRLLEVFLWERALPLKDDPVAEMRDYFHDQGLADASWRYVHRHGSRLFRIPLLMATDKSRLAVCLNYLRVLEAAGLPPPPPPALAWAWFRCFVNPRADRMRFSANWCAAHPTVIRAILREAPARRRDAGFAAFVAEAAGVLHCAMATGLALNGQQARSGWHWLHRHWNVWRARQRRECAAAGRRWDSVLPRTTIGGFDVVPLTSGSALVEEAFEMRHCVDSYLQLCTLGGLLVFSVRWRETGRRTSTLAIRRDAGGKWVPLQIKRFANRPAGSALEKLAVTVAERYTAAERTQDANVASGPHDPLKALEAIFGLRDAPANG